MISFPIVIYVLLVLLTVGIFLPVVTFLCAWSIVVGYHAGKHYFFETFIREEMQDGQK